MKVTIKLLQTIRSHFQSPERVVSWFPGHMAKGLREMQAKLAQVDTLIEVRDARIPLSSINPKFEQMLKDSVLKNRDSTNDLNRIIVYNKSDLIPVDAKKDITKNFKEYTKDKILFTNKDMDQTISNLLRMIKGDIKNHPLRYPFLNVMVVGMPNVGKSSLINSLRRVGVNKGKALTTGGQPGVTRKISSTIKVNENPPIYLLDTPGVMIPHIPDPIISLKVALTGGIHDHLADEVLLCDYLLFELNQKKQLEYIKMFEIETDDIQELLEVIAKKTGLLLPGGIPDITGAAKYFLKRYRLGKFGNFILDDISPDGFKHFFHYIQIAKEYNKVLDGKISSQQLKSINEKGDNLYDVNPNHQLLPSKQIKRKAKRLVRLQKIKAKKAVMPGPKF